MKTSKKIAGSMLHALYIYSVLGQLLFKCNSLHITYYLQQNYLATVT